MSLTGSMPARPTPLSCSCQGTRAASKEGAVGSRVALEREHAMRWFENDRYAALVRNLAGAGNQEACFVLGLTLVFAQGRTGPGADCLARAAAAGHKVAAYVLAVLHYGDEQARGVAEQYIRQVEGEDAGGGARGRSKANGECVRCREQAIHAVREVTWKVAGTMAPVPVAPPPAPAEVESGQSCKGGGCGVPAGWSAGGCAVFCSDGCRIRHEYSEFFSRVSLLTVAPTLVVAT